MTQITKPNPIGKLRKTGVVVEDVDIALAVNVVAHGGRFYLSVRSADMEFWGIEAGDRVLMRITRIKRTPKLGEDF